MTAIFFTAHKYIRNYLSMTVPLHVGRNCWWGVSLKSIFIPVTIERISLSVVISRQAPKECAIRPAANVSHRLIRYVVKVDSTNGGNLLTAALILSSEAITSCRSRSCFDKASFRQLAGGLSPKKAAVVHSCGISERFCYR